MKAVPGRHRLISADFHVQSLAQSNVALSLPGGQKQEVMNGPWLKSTRRLENSTEEIGWEAVALDALKRPCLGWDLLDLLF